LKRTDGDGNRLRAVTQLIYHERENSMTRTIAIAALFAAAALPAAADHANPWATADDTVLSQFHDVNQARSADTPGEDEMNGVMERTANGKLGGASMDLAEVEGADDAERGREGGQGGGSGEGGQGGGSGGEAGQGQGDQGQGGRGEGGRGRG
jgi:hypothetical protein